MPPCGLSPPTQRQQLCDKGTRDVKFFPNCFLGLLPDRCGGGVPELRRGSGEISGQVVWQIPGMGGSDAGFGDGSGEIMTYSHVGQRRLGIITRAKACLSCKSMFFWDMSPGVSLSKTGARCGNGVSVPGMAGD